VKKVSAMRSAAMSSSLFWRVIGLALVHSIVVLLRSPFPNIGLVDFGGVAGSRMLSMPCPLDDVRSLDDREWASPLLSRIASALVGDFSVLGTASSSIVFPRDLEGVAASVRLRMVMPWRCRSLRFYASQPQPISPVTRRLYAHMATTRAALSVEAARARRRPATAGPYYVACLALATLDAAWAHNLSPQFLIGAWFVPLAGAVTDSLPHCMLRCGRRLERAWWSCRGGAAVQPFPRQLGPFGASNFESFDIGCGRPSTPLASPCARGHASLTLTTALPCAGRPGSE
jgi:hypothetical protein